MKELLGKRILWQHQNKKERRWTLQVESAKVVEVSPSGSYICLERIDYPIPLDDSMFYEKQWYPVDKVEVLEVLEGKE